MAKSLASRARKVAYGKPKRLNPPGGRTVEGLSNLGVKVVQYAYLRSTAFGYRKGRGK